MKTLCWLVVMGFICQAQIGVADEGTRKVLIVCGHPGDAPSRAECVETLNTLVTALTTKWSTPTDEIRVLFGTPQMRDDGEPFPGQVNGPATLEDLGKTVDEIKLSLGADDALWVILLGHSYFDGRHAWFNLSGPDPNETQLGEIFQGLKCRECVFWLTTSASGQFVRPLSGGDRIVIAATDSGGEIEATLFPAVLAEVLLQPPAKEEFDVDQNGSLSLLDLYLTICRRVAQKYVDETLALTEHAQLDDNGDGRGRDVQQYFLSEELGGRLRSGAKPTPRGGQVDGAKSATILLHVELQNASTGN
ncbi:hypothetical protein [Planctomicrobium piriforme]|nr:hypothetical protein [Planctomicrobium piriforme]